MGDIEKNVPRCNLRPGGHPAKPGHDPATGAGLADVEAETYAREIKI
jgi:hypothetical protein